MNAVTAFNSNAGLNLRFPRCPAPRCVNCKSSLNDVRPFRTQPNGAATVIECLAECGRCGTKHKGTRRLQRTPQGSRYVGQHFEIWTDEAAKELAPVAEALATAAASGRLKPELAASAKRTPVRIIPVRATPPAQIIAHARRRRLSYWVAAIGTVAAIILGSAFLL